MNRTADSSSKTLSAFQYRNASSRRTERKRLYCEGVTVADLAKRFGTPLYVYSASAIRARFRIFDRAFKGIPHTICYSVKANSNRSVLRLLAALRSGFDVVSGGELERLVRISRKTAAKSVFSGVGKTPAEMRAALKTGILLFNMESEAELHALAACSEGMKKVAPVALRVNPDVPAETHPYISTGLHQHKFGVPMQRARELYAQAAKYKYLRVAGISVHIGSQIRDVKPFTAAMEHVAALVRELREDGHTIRYVDAGGGLGISYQHPDLSDENSISSAEDFAAQVNQYAEAVMGPLRSLKVHLLLEPGRSIIAPAGALLTRVIYQKNNGTKKFLIVDAAMNDLIRPSLYSAYHEIVPAELKEHTPTEKVDVVGPICETGDFFARDRELPASEEGDLLALLDAGAYGMVLTTNYNTRPSPAEILVEGKSAKVVRRRQTVSDLMRLER